MQSRYRWVVLGVGALGAGAFATLRMGLPALGPALRETYALTLAEVGFVLSAVSVGVILTMVPWGVLTDRIGERPVLTIGLTGTGAALALATLTTSYAALLACLVLAGMMGAAATGATGRAVMGWFARTERGTALGARQMALPIGGGVAALTLPLLAAAGGVRAALWALAGVMVLAAIAALVWMRDAPPPTAFAAGYVAPPPVRDPRMWRLGAASALLVVGQSAMLGFLVLFLHDERGVAVATAAACLAVLQLTGAAARLAAGRRSDREGRRVPLLRRIAAVDAVLLALVAALTQAPGVLLYPLLLLAGVVAMSWNGLSFTAAAEIAGRVQAGTAMGLQNTLVGIGTATAPAAFGAVVAATTWWVAFAATALAPLLAWVLLAPLVADEEHRGAERERRLRSHRLAA